jgi:hypothetical protein
VVDANVSEKHTVSIFSPDSPKLWHLPTSQQDPKTQNIIIIIIIIIILKVAVCINNSPFSRKKIEEISGIRNL